MGSDIQSIFIPLVLSHSLHLCSDDGAKCVQANEIGRVVKAVSLLIVVCVGEER